MAVAKTKAVVKRCKNLTLEPKDLSFEELRQMTNDFSQSQEISRGELGVVYKDLTMSISRRSFINLAGSSIQTLFDSLAIAMKIMEMQFIANRQIERFALSTCIVTASKHIFLMNVKDLTGTHATKLFRGFVRLYIIFMRDRKNLFIIWT